MRQEKKMRQEQKMVKKQFASIMVLGALALTSQVAQAAIVTDNFNTADTTNLGDNLATRQSGTAAPSGYTEETDTQNTIDGNKLVKTGGGTLTLNTNLVSYLGANKFSVSVELDVDVGGTLGWTSMSLLSATDNTRGKSPFSFFARDNQAAVSLISIGYGTGSAVNTLNLNAVAINTALGISTFSTLDNHTYTFDATGSSATAGTFDFLIDGTVVANDLAYSFSDATSRTISWVGNNATIGKFDNLSVIPEPATLGLITAVGAGLIWIRRTFTI